MNSIANIGIDRAEDKPPEGPNRVFNFQSTGFFIFPRIPPTVRYAVQLAAQPDDGPAGRASCATHAVYVPSAPHLPSRFHFFSIPDFGKSAPSASDYMPILDVDKRQTIDYAILCPMLFEKWSTMTWKYLDDSSWISVSKIRV